MTLWRFLALAFWFWVAAEVAFAPSAPAWVRWVGAFAIALMALRPPEPQRTAAEEGAAQSPTSGLPPPPLLPCRRCGREIRDPIAGLDCDSPLHREVTRQAEERAAREAGSR